MSFDDILKKKECTAHMYNQFKEQFDAAVRAGLISSPEEFDRITIKHGGGQGATACYRWKLTNK